MQKAIFRTIGILLVVILLWFFRPWFHGIAMFFYTNPVMWIGLFAATFIAIIAIYLFRKDNHMVLMPVILFSVVFLTFLVIGVPLGEWYSQMYIANTITPSIEEIQELSESDPDFVRIVPRDVAQRYAIDALQYPRFKLDTSDIAIIDGQPHWSFTIVPDGIVNTFRLKDKGALYVDMSNSQRNSQVIEQDFQIGPKMLITDSLEWNMFKQHYFVDLGDSYIISKGEELYLAVPLIEYDIKFFYSVPKWGGVALVNSEGVITFLNPEEALKHSVLDGQKLYPEELVRKYINSFRFSRGIMNYLFYHEDQLEIADVLDAYNRQPFLAKTKNGLKWLTAVEPYGHAHGIFRIYQTDARTGKIEMKKYTTDEMLLGPVKAMDYVRKEQPQIDWDTIRAVEPIPMVIKGQLYWEVRVAPKDGSGISYVAFVNALDGNVVELHTNVQDFLRGEAVLTEDRESIENNDRNTVQRIEQRLLEILEDLQKLKIEYQ